MFAMIDLPGGQHFDYHGPVTRAEAQIWLEARISEIVRATGQYPRGAILSNKAALRMRYQDGSKIIWGEPVDPFPLNYKTTN